MNQRDTFLIGHARRMQQYRKREREKNPELYALSRRNYMKTYRLRKRLKLISNQYPSKELERLLKIRESNKERQRRYRMKQSSTDKSIRQEKDRNRKRCLRKHENDCHGENDK